jgi:hypothetical protein
VVKVNGIEIENNIFFRGIKSNEIKGVVKRFELYGLGWLWECSC